MPKKKRAVTIQDVAKTAGVSVSTVSRVLNGKADVANETQDHIRSVIDNLGYTTNLAARSMRSQKKNLIGLIMPDIAYPFAIEVMKGVNRAIAESEFDLLVYTTGDVRKSGRASHEQKYVSLLANSITDGVVIVAPVAGEFSNIDAPLISIDPAASNPTYPAVHATNYQGALDAMTYLLGLGHTRIGFISGRAELKSSSRRLEGYRDALQKAELSIDQTLIAAGDFTTPTGADCARVLLTLPSPPTAIFASNDQMALGVFEVAHALGLRIPDDLSVVGFDNISESGYLRLTTVDQFISEMGFIATRRLIQLINGEALEQQIYRVSTQLVVRDSCRALTGGVK